MPSQISQLISEISAAQTYEAIHPARAARLREMQAWQSARLQRTYADFASDARYRDALDFFVRDLYGPHDFSARNRQIAKVTGTWERLLPQRGVDAILGALQLEALSQSLDLSVTEQLSDAPLDEALYASAYRAAGRREDRQHQIKLIIEAGQALDGLIRAQWVHPALKVARRPARLLGVMALHEFLERGFTAFAKMEDATDLLRAIEEREVAIMNNLFAARPHPFAIEANTTPRRA
ncbi:MAG TPA: hypothetical protein VFS47_13770 [Steroidobacteraceae bacterium]|nr:hypothetical protein [Steroidobacteraceae bacterium]